MSEVRIRENAYRDILIYRAKRMRFPFWSIYVRFAHSTTAHGKYIEHRVDITDFMRLRDAGNCEWIDFVLRLSLEGYYLGRSSLKFHKSLDPSSGWRSGPSLDENRGTGGRRSRRSSMVSPGQFRYGSRSDGCIKSSTASEIDLVVCPVCGRGSLIGTIDEVRDGV